MDDEIFTITQAAHYLKVGDRSWRIRKTDIDMYLRDNTNGLRGVAINE